MKTESIEYQDGDARLRWFLAHDATQSSQRPGILVTPSGFGLGNNTKPLAEMLAAFGYGPGGTAVFELARDGAPLTGVVTLHGGLETQTPATLGQVSAKILVCTSANDPSVPVAHANAVDDEMTLAGVDGQIIRYGSRHGSTYPAAASRGID